LLGAVRKSVNSWVKEVFFASSHKFREDGDTSNEDKQQTRNSKAAEPKSSGGTGEESAARTKEESSSEGGTTDTVKGTTKGKKLKWKRSQPAGRR
jgi:hypothetical protein